MTKAFDTKDLLARLKSKGLEAAEKVLKVVATETIDWAVESLVLSETKYVAFLAPVVAGLKPVILKELDKLDGVAGN